MKQFNFWQDLVTWSAGLNNASSIPWVHSISYGSQGDYPTAVYQERLDAEFQKLGARGVSIIFASGDSGSGCESSNKGCACLMLPSYPATNPYVTSVGATRFLHNNTGPEGAVQAFGSGGGMSNVFPVQDYQVNATDAYWSEEANSTLLPPACSYNQSGRATPDVSALGDIEFQVYQHGKLVLVGGTSASSPSFAAVVTLLNDLRLNANKTTLGFLNPLIYQAAATTPDAFYDVVNGNNNNGAGCCGRGVKSGFTTAEGWDPATGVGTPNYAVLAELVSQLP
jgi:tripeptidyl-peptidase-1